MKRSSDFDGFLTRSHAALQTFYASALRNGDDLATRRVLYGDCLALTFGGLLAAALLRFQRTAVCASCQGIDQGAEGAPNLLRPGGLMNGGRLLRSRRLSRSLHTSSALIWGQLQHTWEGRLEAEASRWPVEWLGLAYEELYGRSPDGTRQRDEGVFFTPPALAEFLARRTLTPLLETAACPESLLSLRVLDPAVGVGFFLLESLRLLAERLCLLQPELPATKARELVASRCLFGADKDSLTLAVARVLLWMEVGASDWPGSELRQNLQVGDALLDESLPWGARFPEIFRRPQGGFDAVLSNPPWGKVKPSLKEFYSHLDPAVSEYQGEDLQRYVEARGAQSGAENFSASWVEYQSKVRSYASRLRQSPAYRAHLHAVDGPRVGGDADLYKFFAARIFQLTGSGGRIGMVLPAGFGRSQGASGLRRLFFSSGVFDLYWEMENRKRLFRIHGMFRFLLGVYEKDKVALSEQAPKSHDPAKAVLRNTSFGAATLDEAQRIAAGSTGMDWAYLRRVSGEGLNVPEVRGEKEQRLLDKLHRLHPPLGEASHGWEVSFVRELDMTNDSGAFRTEEWLRQHGAYPQADGTWLAPDGEEYLPLYEGRMVHQFDCAAKAYEGGHGRAARWKTLEWQEKVLRPHYYVSLSHARIRGVSLTPRVGYCDVTGHANKRSVLAALVSGRAVCGNKVPTCRFTQDDPRLPLLWMAIANSYVVDWLVRRRISTTLNFFHWQQIPFPRVGPESDLGRSLATAALRLSVWPYSNRSLRDWAGRSCGGWPDDSKPICSQERSSLRSWLDEQAAALFELTPQDYALILQDFNPRSV